MNTIGFRVRQFHRWFKSTTRDSKANYRSWKKTSKTTLACLLRLGDVLEFQIFLFPWIGTLIVIWAKSFDDLALLYWWIWSMAHVPVAYNIYQWIAQNNDRMEIARLEQQGQSQWQEFRQTMNLQTLDHYDDLKNYIRLQKSLLFDCDRLWLRCATLFCGVYVIMAIL